MDKELQKVVRDAALGQRRADQLVSVTGLDGLEDRVLVHVEVQAEKTADFSQRMLVYNYRMYDGRPVVMGESYPCSYGTFGYRHWVVGCGCSCWC